MSAPRPTLDFEIAAGYPSCCIAGTDEVGRGCIAGPVVAAAVVLPEAVDPGSHPWLSEVRDSKLLSPATRERLDVLIRAWVRAFAIASVPVEEVDRLNIYHASQHAMEQAVARLGCSVDHVLVDGNAIPPSLRGRATAIVKGDSKSLAIACASILAKVSRDAEMVRIDRLHPGYGHAVHKGYPTPQHLSALRTLGVTGVHRRSFAPVRSMLTPGM